MKLKSILLTAVATLGLTAATMAQIVPTYVPTTGLVGWWPFNGNANDESGNGNDGTVNGATLTSDRFGNANKAYYFSSDAQNINCGNSPTLGLTTNSDLTISYWTISSNSKWPYINKYQNQNASNSNYAIGNSNSNYVITGNGQNSFEVNSGNNTSWVHLSLVFLGNIDSVIVYVNGNYNQKKYVILANNISTSNLILGPRFNPLTSNYQTPNGNLDDIGIWNRALTPEEITNLYTASPTNNNETANTTANVPGAISYQAVARDAQGALLADTNVQVRFTLIADSLSGAEEYVETHTLTTNSLGLFTTAFGAGTPVSNTFGNINWSAGHKFLNVQIDTGSGMVDMGTQQLLSTPYSLYSAKAGEIKNPGLPVFSDNAAALAGGLVAGDMYRTAAGALMVVY